MPRRTGGLLSAGGGVGPLWECYGIRVEAAGADGDPRITASQSGILSLLSKLMRGA